MKLKYLLLVIYFLFALIQYAKCQNSNNERSFAALSIAYKNVNLNGITGHGGEIGISVVYHRGIFTELNIAIIRSSSQTLNGNHLANKIPNYTSANPMIGFQFGKSRFKPYIKGGLNFLFSKTENVVQTNNKTSKSSADLYTAISIGLGMKYFISNQSALFCSYGVDYNYIGNISNISIGIAF